MRFPQHANEIAVALCILSLVLLATPALGCKGEPTPPPPSSPSSNASQYSNDEYSFSLEYPEGWLFEEDALDSIVLFKAPLDTATGAVTVLITAEKLFAFPKVPLDDIVDETKLQLENQVENFSVQDERNIEVIGYPAVSLTLNFDAQEVNITQTHVYFIKDKFAFVLMYTSVSELYTQYLPDFETILNSLRFQ